MTETYRLYAIKYGTHARTAARNFMQPPDPHDAPYPIDYYVWACVSDNHTVVVDTGFTRDAAESRGRGPGPEASILKIKGTEIQQRITELAVEAVGNYALVEAPRLEVTGNEFVPGPEGSQGLAQDYFNMRKTSIYGGSNEIQHNIIAKMVLGL